MSGYIYALTNESMPGQIKLGRTINHPEDRADDLSSDTGGPGGIRTHDQLIKSQLLYH